MTPTSSQLRSTLYRAGKLAATVADELETIESMAFETRVGERPERRASRDGVQGYAHTDTGDPRYKALVKALDHQANVLIRTSLDGLKLLRAGEAPDDKLRGTLLGDEDGSGAQAELERLKRKQRERAERGEYTPKRTEDQPRAPGGFRR